MKPFDLNKALAGEPVVTKDGYKVMDIHYFSGLTSKFKVIAHIENNFSVDTFTVDGKYSEEGITGMDLFMADQVIWINVYWDEKQNKLFSRSMWETEEKAKNAIEEKYRYITTIRIEV